MSGRIFRVGAPLALLAVLALPAAARAHPLGNFTVNHYTRLEPGRDGVRIAYVLDMAEIPAFQERGRIDADRDGSLSDEEQARYASARAEELGRNLRLTVDGTVVAPRLVDHALSFPPGQGGLATLRLEATYLADLPPGADGPVALAYRDENGAGRIGWREIVASPAGGGAEIRESSVPSADQTDALRSYPEDLLNSPLDVREARLTFVPGAGVGVTGGAAVSIAAIATAAGERRQDAYAALVGGELSPSVIAFSLLTALVLGALHALSPGHGKTVVAAYLVGARGTARHAMFLGATVTATHTIGVYALGLVTLYLSQYILPERLYPVLQVISGLLVVGIGAWLLASRLRWAIRPHRDGFRPVAGHAHDHAHATDHEHGHGHEHGHQHGHGHVDGHSHDHDGGLVHSHGGRAHSHLPPGADGRPVTWRSLLALGVSGGLVPCPSALVVLLSAIALHRVAFGLLLIVAFSIGLAAVLVGIGLLLVYARQVLQRFSFGGGLAARLVPVASALLIMVAGVVLTVEALPLIL